MTISLVIHISLLVVMENVSTSSISAMGKMTVEMEVMKIAVCIAEIGICLVLWVMPSPNLF